MRGDPAARAALVAAQGEPPQVPMLVDGGVAVWDRRRILAYLAQTYGGETGGTPFRELPSYVGGVCASRRRGMPVTTVSPLTAGARRDLPPPCVSCVFWQHDRSSPTSAARRPGPSRSSAATAPSAACSTTGRGFQGMIQYGPAGAFPRALGLPAGPPGRDAALVTCTFLEADDPAGACERLMLEALADLKARGHRRPWRRSPSATPRRSARDDRFVGHHTLFDRDFLEGLGFAPVRSQGQVALMRIGLGGLVPGPRARRARAPHHRAGDPRRPATPPRPDRGGRAPRGRVRRRPSPRSPSPPGRRPPRADPAAGALEAADVYVSPRALGAGRAGRRGRAGARPPSGSPARAGRSSWPIVAGPAGAPSMRSTRGAWPRTSPASETLVVTAPGAAVIAVGPRPPAEITRCRAPSGRGAIADPVDRVVRAAELAVPAPPDDEASGTRAALILLGLAALGAAWAVAWAARRQGRAERERMLEARAAAAVRLDAVARPRGGARWGGSTCRRTPAPTPSARSPPTTPPRRSCRPSAARRTSSASRPASTRPSPPCPAPARRSASPARPRPLRRPLRGRPGPRPGRRRGPHRRPGRPGRGLRRLRRPGRRREAAPASPHPHRRAAGALHRGPPRPARRTLRAAGGRSPNLNPARSDRRPRPADNSGMASHLMTNVGPSVWARLFRGLGFTALVVTACSPLWGLAVFFALH